ncbi:hypothetical protein GO755_01030 [Spirosoma sp. HMF4905]|uniref:Uncharacterized protein n=1 Tax=Spirosoma arboris TaxID=2682092 RepID=A0A7K1S4E9_9BACT|nr:hypothetical protein [Spirosoma arboris]MVM28595.1 hypothetical protein [Spirosoma arboris]
MKWDDKNIAVWLDNFEDLIYPVSVYQELVIEGKDFNEKFSIMGAWKTGSLRVSVYGNAYIDQSGNHYEFTNRWKLDAPVGYDTWQYITNNQEFIRAQVPDQFTNENPTIVEELCNKSGFEFIWTMFVMHCFYPKVYPLYDQHVYRAYCSIMTDGEKVPRIAPNKWSEYSKYRDFFIEKLTITGANYWELDRALWAFGKSIKLKKNQSKRKLIGKPIETMNPISLQKTDNQHSGWYEDFTLGGKAKEFCWRLDSTRSLSIHRVFEGNNPNDKKITFEELTAIQDYVQKNGWTDLANSVTKLKDKTEKDGLGKFLYEELDWDTIDAQLASHLSAIFVSAGVWISNNKKRNIQVKVQINKWYETLEAFYLKNYEQ